MFLSVIVYLVCNQTTMHHFHWSTTWPHIASYIHIYTQMHTCVWVCELFAWLALTEPGSINMSPLTIEKSTLLGCHCQRDKDKRQRACSNSHAKKTQPLTLDNHACMHACPLVSETKPYTHMWVSIQHTWWLIQPTQNPMYPQATCRFALWLISKSICKSLITTSKTRT